MTERSAETAARSGKRPSSAPGSDDTAIRPSLADRIQAKLTSDGGAEKNGGAAERSSYSPPDAAPNSAKAAKPAKSAAATPEKAPKPVTAGRGPRRARLRLTRIDPWSVMKTSFLLAIAFGIVTVVSVGMIWTVLDQAGVWTSVNDTVRDTIGGEDGAAFDIENYVGTSRVLGFTMLVSALNVILITAIATLGAFLYNMSAALLGGVEVTLAEDN
ncbi:DUF3566 domain-containing protein [Nocardioides nanhaiensis]|uniref:DUF3566 domain-containing protein n=1 Tax=Nocardioides nanhaiensis TaxID=1476871 RepID=A0ABP8WF00_9ACTN